MNTKRALLKIGLLVLVCVAIIGGLVFAIDDTALATLKYSLNLWTVIALVILINVVSFVCFILMAMAYHWIKSDIKDGGDA